MIHPTQRDTERQTDEPQRQIRLLHVDDDPEFTRLVKRWFDRTHDDVTVVTETDPTRALGRIEHGPGVDTVISDYRMPEMTGLEFLEQSRAQERDLPFVMVTAEGSEAIASEAIHHGVTDYFTKQEVSASFALFVERVRSLALQRRAVVESRRFGTLIEILNVPVMVLDIDGETLAANSLFDELSGRKPGAKHPRLEDIVVEEETDTVAGYLQQLRGDDSPDLLTVHLAIRTGENGNASAYRAQMAAVPGVEVKRTGVLVVLEPESAERQFRATIGDLVGWATGPYLTVDDDWAVTVVNQQAQALFGEAEESIIGHSLWEFFPAFEDATFHDQLRSVKRHSTPLDATVYYGPSQTHFHVRAYRTSTGVAIYLQDITERVEREQELERQAERFQEFAKIVAHDLRNPISAAKGYAQIVAETGCEDEKAIEVVEQSIRQAESIIDQTLTFAREGQLGEVVAVDLESAVERSWRAVTGAWGDAEPPTASIDIESNVRFRADTDGLVRLLANLLRNSVEHGTGGHSVLESDDAEASVRITVGALTSADTTVGFYVEDDGPGIPADERGLVFETRYSTSETGTGFGLAIVEQIAVAHGWSVTVTEGTEGGARFEFTDIDPTTDTQLAGGGEAPPAEVHEDDDD